MDCDRDRSRDRGARRRHRYPGLELECGAGRSRARARLPGANSRRSRCRHRRYRDRLAFWAEVSASGARGLAYAETGDAGGATQWDLLRDYFWASQVGAFNLTEATYDELRSAGELGLLGDPRLRDRLASYYTNSKNPTLSESPEYRKHVRGLIPLDIQLYLWENAGSPRCQESNGHSPAVRRSMKLAQGPSSTQSGTTRP